MQAERQNKGTVSQCKPSTTTLTLDLHLQGLQRHFVIAIQYLLVLYFLIEPSFLAELNVKRSAKHCALLPTVILGTVAQKEILTYDEQFPSQDRTFLFLLLLRKGQGRWGWGTAEEFSSSMSSTLGNMKRGISLDT